MKPIPNTMSVSEARSSFLALPQALAKEGGPHSVAVTKRGKPVLALLDWELYESLVETLEVLGDEDLTSDLRESLRQLKEGKSIPWPQAKKRLGL